MNFNKALNFFLAGIAAVFAFLYYTHTCPVCPIVVASHSEGTVQIHTEGKGDSAQISHVADTSKMVKQNKKPETGIPVTGNQPENSVQDNSFETGFEVPETNTDLLYANDSICKEEIKVTIQNNQVQGFSFKREYSLPYSKDTAIQYVPVPVHKNTLTLGLFAGKSAGINIGYRFNGNHITAGYDVIQKGAVFGFNFDIK